MNVFKKGEYIDKNYKTKCQKISNSFCVQNHLFGWTCPINIMLIGHNNRTTEPSDKHQYEHV
jgi:hypothetical protein